MRKIGYARVSTPTQNLDRQIAALPTDGQKKREPWAPTVIDGGKEVPADSESAPTHADAGVQPPLGA